jgi:hypothetical protein
VFDGVDCVFDCVECVCLTVVNDCFVCIVCLAMKRDCVDEADGRMEALRFKARRLQAALF